MCPARPFDGDVFLHRQSRFLFPDLEHPTGISRRLKTQEVLMKASLALRETGEPKSVLKLAEVPTPPLAPGEALVRVLLSPMNTSDMPSGLRTLRLSAGIASQPRR